METWKSMIAWFFLTVVLHQNGCGLSAQNPLQPYSVSLSPYANSGFQSRLIPILTLNSLFNKNHNTHGNNNAAIAALQREINSLTARVTALEASVAQIKAKIATINNTINCTKGSKLVLGKCYIYVTSAKTFDASRSACVTLGAHLALPIISVSNNAWGIAVRKAFPAADKFWIGVFYTAHQTDPLGNTIDSDAYDIDGNEIASDIPSNSRWMQRPPPDVPSTPVSAPVPPFGVFVTIPPTNPGRWTISPDEDVTRMRARPYLCQKK